MKRRAVALLRRCDPRKAPTIRLAFALSIALHALVLMGGWAQKPPKLPLEDAKPGGPGRSLALRLAPPPQPAPPPGAASAAAPAPMPQRRSPVVRKPPAAMEAPRPPAAPPVLALERPAPSGLPPPPAQPKPPAPARAPASEDFAAYVAARQREREARNAPAPPARVETEQERHTRTVVANLGLDQKPTFGERIPGGGTFQLQSMTSDEAEFLFFGWNKDIRRNARQMVSVRRGGNPSIEVAVVRRMIAIIREHESGDFLWESRRMGRYVTLSARVADNAGLEDVLMDEFFPEYLPPKAAR